MRKKLHTHYDNLKVARNAPPEVIRAAYKTLSQKYHPDRNPDNAEASRIMALINTSYEVLSDQEKRKSHDLWIAEQEVVVRRQPPPSEPPRARRAEPKPASPPPTSASTTLGHRLRQHWAVRHMLRYGLLYLSSAVFIWTFSSDKQAPAVTMPRQYVATPPAEPGMDLQHTTKRTLVAPNGASWPQNAGYVDGYPKLRMQGLSTVTVDNRQNDGDVFVKLVYLGDDQAFPVRQFFIPARGKFTLTKVTPGNYDIRYRNLYSGALARSEAFKLEESSTTDGIQFSKITMTLYKVENGNMQTYKLRDEEF